MTRSTRPFSRSGFLPLAGLLILPLLGSTLGAQGPAQPAAALAQPAATPAPAARSYQLVALPAPVLTDQWTATGLVVSAPERLQEVMCDQSIALLIAGAGPEGERLYNTPCRVTFTYGPRSQDTFGKCFTLRRPRPGSPLLDWLKERLGPAGADPAQALLAPLNITYMVPGEIPPGTLRIQAYLKRDGREEALEPLEITVRDYATAAPAGFTSPAELEIWMRHYHRHPQPERLWPAIRFMSLQDSPYIPTVLTFLIEALKRAPGAAQSIQARLQGEVPRTRSYAAAILQWSGYDIKPLLPMLDNEARRDLRQNATAPDPYEGLSDRYEDLEGTILSIDRLWNVFMATGDPRPVRTIVNVLQWKEDFLAFEKLRKRGKLPEKPTASQVHGMLYKVAGFSLQKWAATIPLVMDYVDAIKANPGTAKPIRESLEGLLENPAFRPEEGEKQP